MRRARPDLYSGPFAQGRPRIPGAISTAARGWWSVTMNALPLASVTAAFLLIGIWCTNARVPAIEADLRDRVGRTLSAAAVSFHAVEARGRRVWLSGVDPTQVEAARERAGAVWGVAAVDVTPEVSATGPWFRIEAEEDLVTISGVVGSQELQSRIRQDLARSLPGRKLSVQLSVEPPGATPISWPSTFEPLFTVAGRRIGNLALTLDGAVLTVAGVVIDERAVDSLGAQFIGAAPGVRLHNALRPGASPQSRLDAAVSGAPITFDEGSARLDARARALLDAVARALRTSPGSRISVRVHADPSTSGVSASRLGRARAEAIARFLAQKGVDPEGITAEGLGPPPSTGGGTTVPTVQISLSEG